MPRRPRSPVARVLADLARALGRHRIDWYLFGAQAAALRGLRRATVDVDVTVFAADADGETIARWVDRDFALQAGLAEASAEACDEVEIVHLPEAGHWIQHEEAERVNALLLAFLRKRG